MAGLYRQVAGRGDRQAVAAPRRSILELLEHRIVAWLLTPLSGASRHGIQGWEAWHGRLMVLAWTVLLPVGALVARFGKVPRQALWPAQLDRQAWWQTHRAVQSSGIAVMSVAAGVALLHASRSGRAATIHHVLGWIVVAVGWTQGLSALLRGTKGGPTDVVLRGDHYDMTRRRVAFEWLHKSLGWLVLPAVWAATAYGLLLADAPRWMPIVIALWWAAWLAAFVALQRSGRCVDTYQAIWGDAGDHPGNARRPIGWGVVRGVEGRLPPRSRGRGADFRRS